MIFENLFLQYKNQHPKKEKLSFKKLHSAEKWLSTILSIFFFADLTVLLLWILFLTLKHELLANGFQLAFFMVTGFIAFYVLICLVIFAFMHSHCKENPYPVKRIANVISLLDSYKIDFTNEKQIDLLIEEAKNAKSRKDYSSFIGKNIKSISVVITPIVLYFCYKIVDDLSMSDLLKTTALLLFLIIVIYFGLVAIYALIQKILYRINCYWYDEFISDMRQIKIMPQYCQTLTTEGKNREETEEKKQGEKQGKKQEGKTESK